MMSSSKYPNMVCIEPASQHPCFTLILERWRTAGNSVICKGRTPKLPGATNGNECHGMAPLYSFQQLFP
ncbi:Uncharacterized protein HZ326_27340 [Fusarium oxysporum f. sp. albedinis]|nr:Uncharacterized protein HZ326_27340 [Fusarium oxysporum f. sp. albedinis]